jgi:hypothetical protein
MVNAAAGGIARSSVTIAVNSLQLLSVSKN